LEIISSSNHNPGIIISGEIKKNTGDTAGAEVIQIYVGDIKSSLLNPKKELKHSIKYFLNLSKAKDF